ncbi:hypothetical protein [Pedobacter sp. UC225_65]|uniref:hypothetical protein n=1 Tax=Pedobacter sp. UC225_65 TaxID=3350173 RepID=UPI00366BE80B
MAIKTTKNLLLGLIVLLTILLFIQACKKNENENSGLLGTHILKKDVVKNVTENNQNVGLTATDFDITSCPPEITCISGGYSRVKIKFKDETSEQTLTLCLGTCTVFGNVVTLYGIKYKVKLEEVVLATSKVRILITKADS